MSISNTSAADDGKFHYEISLVQVVYLKRQIYIPSYVPVSWGNFLATYQWLFIFSFLCCASTTNLVLGRF